MERGLLWLPLLVFFSGLAWAGWNEYRKLEAYKLWAANFERAKYDIYAVLGQTADQLVWGIPTRQGPVQIQQVTLSAVQTIVLYEERASFPVKATVPKGCQVALGLVSGTGQTWLIPFTDVDLATRWQKQLQSLLQALESTPQP
ncbi:MAG: hypothetical protein AAFX01_11405 [Cyanobacteria bacterium J06638_28]